MNNVSLVRVDSRLIHGQIVTMWMKQYPVKRILVGDDKVAKDSVLKQMYGLVAPGIKIEVLTIDDLVALWNKDQFGSISPNLLVFKGIPQLKEAYDKGLKISKLQIGGIASAPGRKVVTGSITMNDEDAKTLMELEQDGVDIIFQMIPNHKPISWSSIRAKHYTDL